MLRWSITAMIVLGLVTGAQAVVFMNEIAVNPPGSLDDTREFIELMGTPGKKLDGYGLAFIYGDEFKLYPLGSIPPAPTAQEIDEFFSLDGLSLGSNGILILAIGTKPFYPTVLDDSNFVVWSGLWNGGLDTVGKLENDGSKTIMLVRNRPGATEANPAGPLRWGKDIVVDGELVTPVEDPVGSGTFYDQYGNGSIDKGEPNNMGGSTPDLRGFTTPGDVSDDLEIVDELSWEHEKGWEYDLDNRKVDAGVCSGGLNDGDLCEDGGGCDGGVCVGGSALPGLPPRNVHTLDDPQDINPDLISRVDYRTKGPGWTPAPGGTGAGPNGNNPQDTATEQWIRGESVIGSGGVGASPQIFYSNASVTNPDAIQPYETQVPLWLDDGQGIDYDFSTANTYQLMAGRINPLATTFIPGDSDRDGDADADDIAKIAAVFGDDDWIFSNSFAQAPEGKAGDPSTQTRPWDVDATGDNGIEPSDLQWTLNFQGDTTGFIVGRQYDDTVPAATGVYLNSNTGVACSVTLTANVPGPRTRSTLKVGDVVEFMVAAQVTSGANTTAGQENGVMQFVHDLDFSAANTLRVMSVIPLSTFNTTRTALQSPQGVNGDAGIHAVNGYTTSFAEGVSGPASLYLVTCKARTISSTDVTLGPATMTRLAASTPHGLKLGHTDTNGDPESSLYPASAATVTVTSTVKPDADLDGDVDMDDVEEFDDCAGSPGVLLTPACAAFDMDGDGDGDQDDFAIVQRCFSGPAGDVPADCDAVLP